MKTGHLALMGLASAMYGAGPARAAVIDLTSPMSSGVINGARFETSDFRAAGTGLIDPFVRLQHNDTEQGYNTSGRPVPFDELNALNFTHDLTLGGVGTRMFGGVNYYEFLLDINQVSSGDNGLLSLDRVQIYTSGVGSQTTATVSSLGALRYDMDAGGDNWVRLNYNLGSGSGQGDMRMLVPVADFAGDAPASFVYLYSAFGDNHRSNAGFEEWAVHTPVPAPASALAGLVGAAAIGLRRRRTAWNRP